MINNFLNSEPEWGLTGSFPILESSMNITDWLSEPGSLTQRIKQTFSGEFAVLLQEQGQSKVFSRDSSQLGLEQTDEAFVREVLLTVSGQIMVFARTTVPNSAQNALESLTNLGSKPLGEVIFSYPDLKRPDLHFGKIPRSSLSANAAQLLGQERYLWARRNTYKIAGQVFLVSEFFLPIVFEGQVAMKNAGKVPMQYF